MLESGLEIGSRNDTLVCSNFRGYVKMLINIHSIIQKSRVNVTRDLISQFVDECIGFDDRVVYSVVIGDRVIGLIFLHDLGKYGNSAEVGCMLSEDYWHRGIMSSLLSRILKRDEFEKYYARMYRENKSSMGLFKKLGFEIDDNFPKISDEIVMVLRK